jgi:hypothetical protein
MNTFIKNLMRGLAFGLGFGLARAILRRPILAITAVLVIFYFASGAKPIGKFWKKDLIPVYEQIRSTIQR